MMCVVVGVVAVACQLLALLQPRHLPARFPRKFCQAGNTGVRLLCDCLDGVSGGGGDES